MKLDNETRIWLEGLARAGCNQRDVANQLMQRLNVCIETDPPIYPSDGVLTYEHAVNLYKSARKRVRKSSTDMLIAKTQIQCGDDDQVYVTSHTPVFAKPNGDPIGIFIPTEAQTMPQVSLEGPEQAPEAATPSRATPSPSAASPEPPAKDPPDPFHELFFGFNSSATPPLSKYVSEDPQCTYDTWCKHVANPTVFVEKTQTPQVKNYRHALCDYIESVAAGGERNSTIEETYADDVDLVDRLVSLLGSETRNKWDNGTLTHDQIVKLFKDALGADFGWEDAAKELGQRLGWRWDFAGTLEKRALFEEMCDKVAAKIARQLGEDDLEKAFWDFDTSRKRGSERDAFKMVVRAALSQRELFNSESKPANGDSIVGRDGKLTTDPNNDRYDRIYEAQLGMYNGIRDLTDAVRALPISSVIAAKDETIAAKDAELETLREYVRHLQRQVGAS